MADVVGNGLSGARDAAVGDVRAADVVHVGGVRPVGVDGNVRVVSTLQMNKTTSLVNTAAKGKQGSAMPAKRGRDLVRAECDIHVSD